MTRRKTAGSLDNEDVIVSDQGRRTLHRSLPALECMRIEILPPISTVFIVPHVSWTVQIYYSVRDGPWSLNSASVNMAVMSANSRYCQETNIDQTKGHGASMQLQSIVCRTFMNKQMEEGFGNGPNPRSRHFPPQSRAELLQKFAQGGFHALLIEHFTTTRPQTASSAHPHLDNYGDRAAY